ncbi:MAG TPA: tRNA preQ1(34) S-adenosylmethionine ribosyltransferase-isomerase QueA [Clostridia bacterium]|nr:tRNA preQ1(34) S-adenosylmethionine ribosyltransferase-isomerase QueA [Clostridia bacterium]
MTIEDIDYSLPQDLIAQKPIEPRDRSRLMVLFRSGGAIEHSVFKDVGRYLDCGDCLVLNDTRVLPARLYGHRKDTGGKVEVLLVERLSGDFGDGLSGAVLAAEPVEQWRVLAKPARRLKPGSSVVFGQGDLEATVISAGDRGERVMEFRAGLAGSSVYEKILSLGRVPLPPYIKESLDQPERYQTVYALHPGSVAAPTAGLHFTEELLGALRSQGIVTANLTLHVGPGTFRPIETEDVRRHVMHEERFNLTEEACKAINSAKDRGNRVVAVGTTCVRVLETCATPEGRVKPMSGRTSLYIYPPYRFRVVDAMITNFHLPRSTLLLLVYAFAGRDFCKKAYEIAIRERYRFYSFGDAMLIL